MNAPTKAVKTNADHIEEKCAGAATKAEAEASDRAIANQKVGRLGVAAFLRGLLK